MERESPVSHRRGGGCLIWVIVTGTVQFLLRVGFAPSLQKEERDMKKVLAFCVLLALWLSLDGSRVGAVDVGWMQKGVRGCVYGILAVLEAQRLRMLKKHICSVPLTATMYR